jgi:hypothetical protein
MLDCGEANATDGSGFPLRKSIDEDSLVGFIGRSIGDSPRIPDVEVDVSSDVSPAGVSGLTAAQREDRTDSKKKTKKKTKKKQTKKTVTRHAVADANCLWRQIKLALIGT